MNWKKIYFIWLFMEHFFCNLLKTFWHYYYANDMFSTSIIYLIFSDSWYKVKKWIKKLWLKNSNRHKIPIQDSILTKMISKNGRVYFRCTPNFNLISWVIPEVQKLEFLEFLNHKISNLIIKKKKFHENKASFIMKQKEIFRFFIGLFF